MTPVYTTVPTIHNGKRIAPGVLVLVADKDLKAALDDGHVHLASAKNTKLKQTVPPVQLPEDTVYDYIPPSHVSELKVTK